MARLKDKVCLITGGASGIGASTVRRFVEEGGIVHFSDIQDDLGQALAAECGTTYHHQDVADEDRWTKLLSSIKAAHNRFDVLVNNAGVFEGGSIEDITVESLRSVLDVNVFGVALGCREAVKMMKQNPNGPSGSIINVSSITGFVGLANGAAYTASKGAVRLLSKSVAVHCAKNYKTIRCNSVHPGAIDTPMNTAAFDASGDPDGMRTMFSGLQPIGRMTAPEEIANGILYLASDESSSTNGTELLIDGGWLAMPPGM